MLVYSAITSLDGYVADETGSFDWAFPSPELHAAVNDLERGVGTYLYGRRLYEVMRFWADAPVEEGSPQEQDYAGIWRAAEKVVYSRTLAEVDTPRTRLEPAFEADAVRALVRGAGTDVSIGGPGLAGQALAAGLVDLVHLFVVPHVVGGGTRTLPAGVRAALELQGERRIGSAVQLTYRVLR